MVEGARPVSRAIDSIDLPASSRCSSHSRSMTRTLVRVSDGRSAQPVADLVEHLLALRRERVDALAAARAGGRDPAVEAVEVELERLELELGRRRVELAGPDHELGDEAGERLV